MSYKISYPTKRQMSEKNVREALGMKPKDILHPNVLEHIRKAVWLNKFDIGKHNGVWLLKYDRLLMPTIVTGEFRRDVAAVRNKLIDEFQRHPVLIKRDLDEEWGRLVRDRDGWKCAMCSETNNLAAHHWCRGAQRSKMARWCLDNGITLCYTCHIRLAHERPDWLLYDSFRRYIMMVSNTGSQLCCNIERLSNIEATEDNTRSLWYAWELYIPPSKRPHNAEKYAKMREAARLRREQRREQKKKEKKQQENANE